MNASATTLQSSAARAGLGTRTVAAIALVFGLALIFTTGFAQSNVLHNAAHDTRHALSFPCH